MSRLGVLRLGLVACSGAFWIGCSDSGNAMQAIMPMAGMVAPPVAGTAPAAVGGAGAGAGPAAAGSQATGRAGASAAGSNAAGSAASGSSGASAAGSGGASTAGSGGSTASAGSSGAAAGDPGGAAGAAGSGGAAGSAGSAGAAPTAGSGGAPAMHEDLGKGDGHDVVLLGDSYMSNTLQFEGTGGGIVPSLLSASGQRYRNYAVQGTMLLMDNTYGPAIPKQWDQAKRANADIKTVVMTGGGNDIIQSTSLSDSCMSGGDECKQLLLNERMEFDKLWTAMAESGVQDIVRVSYATDTGRVNSKLLMDPDLAVPPPICTTGKVRCHDLPTNDLIMKQLAVDNIHPLASANDRVAKAIVDLMQKEGMRR